MLTLSRFISKPFLYRDRKIPDMGNISLINCTPGSEENSGFIIDFLVKSDSRSENYESSIQVYTEDSITINTRCKFRCNCPSFKYEFETMLYNNEALIGNPSSTRMPKKRTGIFVCKHLMVGIIAIQHFNNIRNIIKHVKGEL